MAGSRHSQTTAADARRQRVRWNEHAAARARPRAGRTCAATSDHAAGSTRNSSRSRELTLAGSVWVGARTSAAKSVYRVQHSVPRAAQHKTTTRTSTCQVAPCTGCNGPWCDMQPGMMRRAIRRQRKLQHTRARAHAHTEEQTHTHTRCTRTLTYAHTPSPRRARTHTRTCAHITRTHTHTHSCVRTCTQTHRNRSTHAHARGPSLGAVAGRDAPQPICAQMRADAGPNVGRGEQKPDADVGRRERSLLSAERPTAHSHPHTPAPMRPRTQVGTGRCGPALSGNPEGLHSRGSAYPTACARGRCLRLSGRTRGEARGGRAAAATCVRAATQRATQLAAHKAGTQRRWRAAAWAVPGRAVRLAPMNEVSGADEVNCEANGRT
jgi:hypothetical protein